MKNKLLVAGGAGFIGSNFVLVWIAHCDGAVINLDKLTYAGNLDSLRSMDGNSRHEFVRGDIANRELTRWLLPEHKPRAVVNFAAESHVDRSIHGPEDFISTNVNGTFYLLEEARRYWQELAESEKHAFRFLHVSTDEVYGSLGRGDPAFTETTPYAPNSPYAASKAASDYLIRADHHTYGLPTITTNCSNNYGPYQFPEKLIPLMIMNSVAGKPLPIYGDGLNVRDWFYVGDHCGAIRLVLDKGRVGETYNIGGRTERTNLEILDSLCAVLDELKPDSPFKPHTSLRAFVKDRPGHDLRYAIDARKIESELGWTPKETFDTGIRKTVRWYLENMTWIERVTNGGVSKMDCQELQR